MLSFFESKKIVPRAVKEEEKMLIKQKLSRVSTINLDGKAEATKFFRDLREKFLAKC